MRLNKVSAVSILFITLLFLSGCNTSKLKDSILVEESQKYAFSSDKIIGLSAGISHEDQKGWVFIGEHFDYLVTTGVNGIVTLLKNKNVDTSRITIFSPPSFIINDDNDFTGEMILTYDYPEHDQALKLALTSSRFNCDDNARRIHCRSDILRLKGSIHNKNKSEDAGKIIYFHKPFAVTFYKESGYSAKRVLYPVAIAADIVTFPIQLIGVAIFISNASVPSH